MIKQLPFFKFDVNAWLTGSIQLLSDAEKGTFIDLCSFIWKGNGTLKIDKKIHRKLHINHATLCDRIKAYCELEIMQCDNDILSVKFIRSQIDEYKQIREQNKKNAEMRWGKIRAHAKKSEDRRMKSEDRRMKKEKEGIVKGRFLPPTIQEVEEYAESIEYPLIGESFCSSYKQKDWMVGKNKMKEWKAAVRNWKTNNWGKLKKTNIRGKSYALKLSNV